jgi:beta-lactamase superfamily II metal-dependent hydrolase
MYRVGFGDFFLITVPTESGPKHIVVDCGVYKGKSGDGDIATIKTAVRHMAAETESKLALIIVTHRHADHIVGFSRCAKEFEKFSVDAIWMPIWETEYDDAIQKFQEDLQSLALNLGAALAGREDPISEQIQSFVLNATGEGPGGGSNKKSLELLKTKLGVKPKYLTKGDKPNLPAALKKAGLTAQILGPPPVDELDFMKLMDLEKGVGQYLDDQNRMDADDGEQSQGLMPFEPKYAASQHDYPEVAFREWHTPSLLEEGVRSSTPAALYVAASMLEDFLNNQSLVVLFGWKGKQLLFAGDAQGGNWEYWLYDEDVPAEDPTGLEVSKDSKKILRNIDFYKVGHHGSTNATPIPAVDAMGSGFVSMCSTEKGTYGTEAKGTEVPHGELLAELAKKSALVRSDQIKVAEGDVKVPAAVHKQIPQPKNGRFEVGSCYIDYFL